MEIWKKISELENLYEVSNYGRVRSCEREVNQINNGTPTKVRYKGKILKGRTDNLGYTQVHVSVNGKSRRILVHRLVAEAFCEKPDGFDIVNHLDCNPSNNRADNLEWTTYKGNMQYASALGRMKGKIENLQKAIDMKKIPVVAIKGNERLVFESGAEAGRKLGVNSSHIAAACRKEYGYKRLKGYEFEYLDPDLQDAQKPFKVGKPKDKLKKELSDRMIGNQYGKGKSPSVETRNKISKSLSMPVAQYDLDMHHIRTFASTKEASEFTGISHICDCANGKRKTAGKYIWRYIDE